MSNVLTIIVDMQNDFVTGTLANIEAQKLISPMVQFIKESEERRETTLFTLDTHLFNYSETLEGKHLPIEHCKLGTSGHEVVKELLDASKLKIQINKPTFGMKMNSWKNIIHRLFNSHKIDRINIVGTCTDICVISNALILKSLYPETEIYVYEDLCAGLNKEKHEAALEVMKSCQINVEKYFKG